MFLLCPTEPEQDHPRLVELKPVVQVHLHPSPPPQSAGTIAAREISPTSADHHVPSQETR